MIDKALTIPARAICKFSSIITDSAIWRATAEQCNSYFSRPPLAEDG
jgi:hypothetical protein